MEINKEVSQKIQDLQNYEKNLQTLLLEKQNIQIELNGVTNALNELSRPVEEVYKILEGIMVKSNKEDLIKELEEKKKILDLRINSIEKQERSVDDKVNALRDQINRQITAKGK